MHYLPDGVREAFTIIGLLMLVVVTIAKLITMQRNTTRWNGLGRAIRMEKWAYLSLFLWMLLRRWLPLDSVLLFMAIATFIVVAEVRVMRFIPIVRIGHETRNERDKRQRETQEELDKATLANAQAARINAARGNRLSKFGYRLDQRVTRLAKQQQSQDATDVRQDKREHDQDDRDKEQ